MKEQGMRTGMVDSAAYYKKEAMRLAKENEKLKAHCENWSKEYEAMENEVLRLGANVPIETAVGDTGISPAAFEAQNTNYLKIKKNVQELQAELKKWKELAQITNKRNSKYVIENEKLKKNYRLSVDLNTELKAERDKLASDRANHADCVDKLEEENEKLKAEKEVMAKNANYFVDKSEELQAENDRLKAINTELNNSLEAVKKENTRIREIIKADNCECYCCKQNRASVEKKDG